MSVCLSVCQLIRDVTPMLFKCWFSIVNGGPTLKRHYNIVERPVFTACLVILNLSPSLVISCVETRDVTVCQALHPGQRSSPGGQRSRIQVWLLHGSCDDDKHAYSLSQELLSSTLEVLKCYLKINVIHP